MRWMTALMTGDLACGGSTRNSHADSPLALLVAMTHEPEMSGALDAALSTSPARLAEMRAAARRRLSSLCEEWLGADYESSLRVDTARFASTGQA